VSGSVFRDDELAVMNRAVVRAAQRDEVSGIVPAALRTRHHVVEIEERRVLAAWNPAAMLVAVHNGAARGGRYLLTGAGCDGAAHDGMSRRSEPPA